MGVCLHLYQALLDLKSILPTSFLTKLSDRLNTACSPSVKESSESRISSPYYRWLKTSVKGNPSTVSSYSVGIIFNFRLLLPKSCTPPQPSNRFSAAATTTEHFTVLTAMKEKLAGSLTNCMTCHLYLPTTTTSSGNCRNHSRDYTELKKISIISSTFLAFNNNENHTKNLNQPTKHHPTHPQTRSSCLPDLKNNELLRRHNQEYSLRYCQLTTVFPMGESKVSFNFKQLIPLKGSVQLSILASVKYFDLKKSKVSL